MDKLKSMSVKDYLIKVLSVRLNVPAKTIETIVNFQMEEAHKALSTEHSIELSGFGKFIFNKKKAIKKRENIIRTIEKYKTQDSEKNAFKISNLERSLNIIETKLNQHGTERFQYNRGMEEQIVATTINEESYRGDSSFTESHLR